MAKGFDRLENSPFVLEPVLGAVSKGAFQVVILAISISIQASLLKKIAFP
jgi:hypothetical protein